MIKQLVKKVIESLKLHIGGDNDKKALVVYGLKLLTFEIAVDLFVVGISILLGVLPYLILTTLVFGLLRILAGGAHSQSRVECFITYNTVMWATIYMSKAIKINLAVLVICLITTICIFLLYSPGDTVQKPIRKKKKRKILKVASILAILLIYTVAILAAGVESVVTNIIVIASISTAILLSPIGYWLCRCKKSYKKIGLIN